MWSLSSQRNISDLRLSFNGILVRNIARNK